MKIDLDTLGIMETKKDGKGQLELKGGHILMYNEGTCIRREQKDV